jgi:hypothetical protein
MESTTPVTAKISGTLGKTCLLQFREYPIKVVSLSLFALRQQIPILKQYGGSLGAKS